MTGPEQYVGVNSNEHYYLSMVPAKAVEELRKRYAQRGRHYHTWQHIVNLFDTLQLVDERVACLPAVVLAVLWHDAVYDARRRDNEVRSAQLLRRMTTKLEPYWVERAETMILATQRHLLPEGDEVTEDDGYFLDMDLAILASKPEAYDTYVQQVRREYKHVPEPDWCAGRAAVLRGFLERPELYHTEWGRVMYTRKARENMGRELGGLVRGGA